MRETAAIIRWMGDNPVDRAIILWLAENDVDRDLLTESDIEQIDAYLAASKYQNCSCTQPVVLYPDGRTLTWPELVPHSHLPELPERVEPEEYADDDGLPTVRPVSPVLGFEGRL